MFSWAGLRAALQRLREQTVAGVLSAGNEKSEREQKHGENASYSVPQQGLSSEQEDTHKIGENSGSVWWIQEKPKITGKF